LILHLLTIFLSWKNVFRPKQIWFAITGSKHAQCCGDQNQNQFYQTKLQKTATAFFSLDYEYKGGREIIHPLSPQISLADKNLLAKMILSNNEIHSFPDTCCPLFLLS
jgi:hypothetical protein